MTRINTNIPSLQAGHILARNQEDLTLRLERLSTGLRINRGRDDPAGLIASEVLRSEIRGITQAIENSQRAINVISTAEGALNELRNKTASIASNNGMAHLHFSDGDALNEGIDILRKHGSRIEEVRRQRSTLEDVFMRTIEESKEER